ncbi:MAG: OmpH family outer membrane protein [Bacteroidetes bacterium]|nr:OmpH family outer membrane protein [Bacteroidota bacterium]
MQEEYNNIPEDPQADGDDFQPGNPGKQKADKWNIFQGHLAIELILLIGLAVLYVLFFTSKKNADPGVSAALSKSSGKSVRVVFVNIDSLNNQYTFVKKLKTDLEATGKRFETEILSEQAAFEKEATAFQKQVAANAIPEDKAKIQYEALMQRQQALVEKKDRYTQQVAEKEQAMHVTLLDTVTNFLKRYNRNYKFDYILGLASAGQILLASDTLDITKDVVKELNKEYQEKGK